MVQPPWITLLSVCMLDKKHIMYNTCKLTLSKTVSSSSDIIFFLQKLYNTLQKV